MMEYQEWTPTTKTLQRLEQADLLMSQLRSDLRSGRASEGTAPERRAALVRAQAALETYMSYFYPQETR